MPSRSCTSYSLGSGGASAVAEVKNMQTRDKQLERLGEEYAKNLDRKRTKEEKMKERKRFHEEAPSVGSQSCSEWPLV